MKALLFADSCKARSGLRPSLTTTWPSQKLHMSNQNGLRAMRSGALQRGPDGLQGGRGALQRGPQARIRGSRGASTGDCSCRPIRGIQWPPEGPKDPLPPSPSDSPRPLWRTPSPSEGPRAPQEAPLMGPQAHLLEGPGGPLKGPWPLKGPLRWPPCPSLEGSRAPLCRVPGPL